MSASFAQAKGAWHAWIDGWVDHALQLGAADPLLGYFQRARAAAALPHHGLRRRPDHRGADHRLLPQALGDASAEALFAVEEVTVQETPTNAVTLAAADIEALGGWSPGRWATRADHSLNDLCPPRPGAAHERDVRATAPRCSSPGCGCRPKSASTATRSAACSR
jgi:hypothetical protein